MVDIVDDLIEVKLKNPEDFLKIKETLTRIGVASKKTNTLFQSCHILHKKKKYYIVHFKELFKLDGKNSDLSESDIARRNAIVNVLEDWNLLEIVNPEKTKETIISIKQIKILPHKEKKNWNLEAKYNIGKTKK